MPGKVPTYLQIIFSQIGFQIECQEKKTSENNMPDSSSARRIFAT
jgi:hypothetical protein